MTDRDNIIHFLELSDGLITTIVEHNVYHFIFPRQQTIFPLIQPAHEAVKIRLQAAVRLIRDLKDDDLKDRLNQNGLTGVEWVFKITVVEGHVETVRKKIQDIPFKIEDTTANKIGSQRRTLKRYIRKGLKSIDSILDSIIAAGVPLHPYKEFKDTLLSMLE